MSVTKPSIDEITEMKSKALLSLSLLEMKEGFIFEYEIDDLITFAGKVIKKKIEAFELPIKLSKGAADLLGAFSEENPGLVQLLLLELLESNSSKEITTLEIALKWPNKYPSMADRNYQQKWEEQKTADGTGNKVDSKEFWLERL